ERLPVELVPGATARLARDRLREVVLGPRRLAAEELLPEVVDASGEAAVELRRGDELRFRHRPRQRTPVELVTLHRLRTPGEADRDAVALRPRIRSDEQPALLREADREAAGREDERPFRVGGQGLAEPHVARERVHDPARIEA